MQTAALKPLAQPLVRCLLLDDDAAIRSLLQDYLQQHGMHVEALGTGAGLRRRLPAPDIDLLILDLMLPDDDGLALCTWARQVQPNLAVVMLTAQGDPVSRILGLEVGADDYLPKPFEPRELVARIKAVLRRQGRGAPGTVGTGGTIGHSTGPAARAERSVWRFAEWTFDRLGRQLLAPDGSVVALSGTEFRLLTAFCERPRQALSRERLLQVTRVPGSVVSDRSIDLAVSRLRAKLEPGAGTGTGGSTLIRTVRGEGYLFDAELR